MLALDDHMFRPEDSETTVAEITEAVFEFARQARMIHKIDADRVLIFTIPFDPNLRKSWQQAEKEMKKGGHKIRFDWTKWEVWTVPRGELTGGAVPEWLIHFSDRTACVPSWVAESCRFAGHSNGKGGLIKPLSADQLRDLAAECLAMADYLQAPSLPEGI